jgi:lipopolysaccharide/colanic/teichoic acid biosynthesis glycosyltransferase
MIRVSKHYFPRAARLLLPGWPVVKPGLTGQAQLSCRCGALIGSSRQKRRYDLSYARNRAPFLGLRIIPQKQRIVPGQKALQ